MREEEHACICQPGTRDRILHQIREWSNGIGSAFCWLSGQAGTGKSAILHTIADECDRQGRLAGSFFFSRGKGAREDITKLIPTLAHQIAAKLPSTQSHMQSAPQHDPMLPHKTLQNQLQALLVEPAKDDTRVERYLIVIDGLDECASRDGIVEFIRLLGDAVETHRRPFQFLLASRAERHLEVAFASHLPNRTALWLSLEDSREDVRTYLRQHLMKVRTKYNDLMSGEPRSWPSERDLQALVEKSEGLFIHASTAVLYIGDGMDLPQAQLKKVLEMHRGVDPLYTQVITDASQAENFWVVMGSLMYI